MMVSLLQEEAEEEGVGRPSLQVEEVEEGEGEQACRVL